MLASADFFGLEDLDLAGAHIGCRQEQLDSTIRLALALSKSILGVRTSRMALWFRGLN